VADAFQFDVLRAHWQAEQKSQCKRREFEIFHCLFVLEFVSDFEDVTYTRKIAQRYVNLHKQQQKTHNYLLKLQVLCRVKSKVAGKKRAAALNGSAAALVIKKVKKHFCAPYFFSGTSSTMVFFLIK
jgi:hypothetical protein